MIMKSEWGRLNNKMMAVHLDELSLDLHKLLQHRPIPLAVAPKTEVWNLLIARIAGSRSAQVVDVLLLCLLRVVKGGLCDELIIRSEEFYPFSSRTLSKYVKV